jgi:DNA-binding transcriptional regulator YiaG
MRHSKYFDVLKLIQAQLEGTASDSVYEEIIKDFVQFYDWKRDYQSKSEFLIALKSSVLSMRDSLINGVLLSIQEERNETTENELEIGEIKQVNSNQKMLTFQVLMEMFNVSRPTIYNWEKEGLKITRVGGKALVCSSDLDAFMKLKDKKNESK